MESKFSSHFAHLEAEIRKRDTIIERLRSQLYTANDSVDPAGFSLEFGHDVDYKIENCYESDNEEETENLSGEYHVMSEDEDDIPFMVRFIVRYYICLINIVMFQNTLTSQHWNSIGCCRYTITEF